MCNLFVVQIVWGNILSPLAVILNMFGQNAFDRLWIELGLLPILFKANNKTKKDIRLTVAETGKTKLQFTHHNGNLRITIAIYETTANLKTHWKNLKTHQNFFKRKGNYLLKQSICCWLVRYSVNNSNRLYVVIEECGSNHVMGRPKV